MSAADATRPAWSRRRGFRLALLVFLVLAVAIGGYAWWMETGRHMFQARNWGVVEEGRVWRSGQIHGRLIEGVLRDHEIDLILDLAPDEEGDEHAAREREAARALGVRKVDAVGLNGYGEGPITDYVHALDEYRQARDRGDRVLVHCAGGSERTGAFVAFHRMLYEGWDGVRAWNEYLAFRKGPPKTDHLVEYVNAHVAELAELLRAGAHPPPHGPPSVPFGPAAAGESE